VIEKPIGQLNAVEIAQEVGGRFELHPWRTSDDHPWRHDLLAKRAGNRF
jgi:hypothetical protein